MTFSTVRDGREACEEGREWLDRQGHQDDGLGTVFTLSAWVSVTFDCSQHSIIDNGKSLPLWRDLPWEQDVLAAPRYRTLAKASTCTRKSAPANCGTATVALFGEGGPK